MRGSTIARNYAEALLSLARKADDLEGWGEYISAVADAVEGDPRLRNFLAAPQISGADKNRVIEKAFADYLPRPMMRFLQKLVLNRRQTLIPQVAVEYAGLVDEVSNRVHAQVTLARDASDSDRSEIAAQLSKVMGKEVVPHLFVNPAILGGIVVRVGDRVMDGSVRKRLSTLRGKLANIR